MDYILTHWLALLLAATIGFVLGRITAKDPIQRDRERRDFEAGVRNNKAKLTKEMQDEVQALVRQGQSIEAIKRVRERLGCDLRTSKAIVDSFDR